MKKELCPVCGSRKVRIEFHKGGEECPLSAFSVEEEEHTHMFCEECGFDWCKEFTVVKW